mmetsp:Transcript_19412/g.50475  ORF Transcript_19412/g.50475 Transcript_19412/m.50475 type:complete len:200 (-) Transcript_19412:154-753(-)
MADESKPLSIMVLKTQRREASSATLKLMTPTTPRRKEPSTPRDRAAKADSMSWFGRKRIRTVRVLPARIAMVGGDTDASDCPRDALFSFVTVVQIAAARSPRFLRDSTSWYTRSTSKVPSRTRDLLRDNGVVPMRAETTSTREPPTKPIIGTLNAEVIGSAPSRCCAALTTRCVWVSSAARPLWRRRTGTSKISPWVTS